MLQESVCENALREKSNVTRKSNTTLVNGMDRNFPKDNKRRE